LTSFLTPASGSLRAVFYEQLHCTYERRAFDNWVVWAGNHSVLIDGSRYGSTLARAYVGPNRPAVSARVRVELFVAAAAAKKVRAGDVDARLWTDAGARGFVDAAGMYQDGPGRYLPMHLVCDALGVPELIGNNLVFESEAFVLDATGVFSYTVEFSADDRPVDDPQKEWLSLNDLAHNKNGVIVVSPGWVQDGPSIAEICVRKVGARREEGRFRSGRFQDATRLLEHVPADVVYLLPFFKPGFTDLHTGKDVRKGKLGSVYAVQDFFQIDPELVSPPEEADLGKLIDEGLIRDDDVKDLPVAAAELGRLSREEVLARVGRERLVQVVGRAELRGLTRRAHELGKKVIFDLVLMQTSRDSPLIREHPEWYVLDDKGVPKIHQIAWLVYSDVALFDLVFNWSLQNYLLSIAPYWIETGDLDGVRIDASQTVDRPFLKKIKNRINAVQPQALVLGETLCPLEEAVDIPVDMVYTLLVDYHRDVEHAQPLIEFLEEMHRCFVPQTVAMAYFENHDSPRATQMWQDRYAALLKKEPKARAYWQQLSCGAQPERSERPLLMALLKNLQASLIDASAGTFGGSNLAYGLELGSEWGETTRTDFENDSLLDFGRRQRRPHAALVRGYEDLHRLKAEWPELRDGQVYYQRCEFAGADPDDRVFGYVRYNRAGALLVLHNFDPAAGRRVAYAFDYLPWKVKEARVLFDTYEAFQIEPPGAGGDAGSGDGFVFRLLPLQSQVLRLLLA